LTLFAILFVRSLFQPPVIARASNAIFAAGTFTIKSTGFPVPALAEVGTLPSGVTFEDNGDGTATLTGTPVVLTGGIYNFYSRKYGSARSHTGIRLNRG